jgi:hypothetical protein
MLPIGFDASFFLSGVFIVNLNKPPIVENSDSGKTLESPRPPGDPRQEGHHL